MECQKKAGTKCEIALELWEFKTSHGSIIGAERNDGEYQLEMIIMLFADAISMLSFLKFRNIVFWSPDAFDKEMLAFALTLA